MSFDYSAWIDRAIAFVSAIEQLGDRFAEVEAQINLLPPVTASELRVLERDFGIPLPSELARLYSTGARALRCTYSCIGPDDELAEVLDEALWPGADLYGGPVLLDALELPRALRACRQWASVTRIADDPDARRLWLSALPFIELDNGDYLALDLSEDAVDPAVLYLSHDQESFVLAGTLPAFLAAWERLCYIGPEAWMLEPFRGEDGLLDGESDRARALRRALAPVLPMS